MHKSISNSISALLGVVAIATAASAETFRAGIDYI